uniref:UPAR/Ly6 domain-containing protein n=1 Tax=Iconisemion striatum TaxID=60296 RepID=A0A1A7Y1K7_9TELE
MKRIAFICAVAFCFALGQALDCYQCKIGFWNLCITSKITCNSGEQCFSGVGKAGGIMDIKMKGCLAADKCNRTTSENFPVISNTTAYSMNRTCCITDMCNSAPGLPGTNGLSLALTSVSALFAAHLMV